jgi:hypothetical protein
MKCFIEYTTIKIITDYVTDAEFNPAHLLQSIILKIFKLS